MACHPDLHPGDANAAQHFKRITEAFETLHNFDKRAIYNRKFPPKKPQKKKKTEKGPFDYMEDPNLGNCKVPPAPNFDIWVVG